MIINNSKRKALITGATSGIGFAAAKGLLEAGGGASCAALSDLAIIFAAETPRTCTVIHCTQNVQVPDKKIPVSIN